MEAPAKTRIAPTEIAPETFLIHDHQGEGTAPVVVALNTLVIRAAEPVVVDTGVAENREQFLDDVFGLVEPEDVRWVFLSHDDVDHTGNVERADGRRARTRRSCQLVHGRAHDRVARRSRSTRQRWIDDGDSLDVGDRTLLARAPADLRLPHHPRPVRPDDRLLLGVGQLRHADAHAPPDVAELEADFWIERHAHVPPVREPVGHPGRRRQVPGDGRPVTALRPTAMAGCHTPVIREALVPSAIAATRRRRARWCRRSPTRPCSSRSSSRSPSRPDPDSPPRRRRRADIPGGCCQAPPVPCDRSR